MDIQYTTYDLTPKKRINRLSDLSPKQGIFLRARMNGDWSYADYFSHPRLGDRSNDIFLSEFKEQKVEYDQKVLHHLLNDHSYRTQSPKPFKNHQLYSGTESLRAPVIKYKLFDSRDTFFQDLILDGKTLRLDGNGKFSRETFEKFVARIPVELLKGIEYMEDPMMDLDWSGFPIAGAQDFVMGEPSPYYIYKPNCEFFPANGKKVIFSGYMGSSFGFWHAYAELIQKADLNLCHGIIAEDFYEEEVQFLEGDYYSTFIANMDTVKGLYRKMEQLEWKTLCSI